MSGGWIVAEVLEPIEAETPYGGRSISWVEHGQAWLRPGAERPVERVEDGRLREGRRLTAQARCDERLKIGRVLRFRGGDWRVREVTPDGGRMRLELEALR